MTKNELIKQLQDIPGNPVVVIKTIETIGWQEVEFVIATGEHRNAITFTPHSLPVDYLGPVP